MDLKSTNSRHQSSSALYIEKHEIQLSGIVVRSELAVERLGVYKQQDNYSVYRRKHP